MMRELHTLLVNAKIEGPYLMVGHSFGGSLARLYVHRYPDEVVGLVLVDSTPAELFERVPVWSKALEQKRGMFRVLAPLSSLGLFALVPDNIPNRGFSDEALARYRAISAATDYFVGQLLGALNERCPQPKNRGCGLTVIDFAQLPALLAFSLRFPYAGVLWYSRQGQPPAAFNVIRSRHHIPIGKSGAIFRLSGKSSMGRVAPQHRPNHWTGYKGGHRKNPQSDPQVARTGVTTTRNKHNPYGMAMRRLRTHSFSVATNPAYQ